MDSNDGDNKRHLMNYMNYDLFLSDIHLGHPLSSNKKELINLLERNYRNIYLIGDIIDSWEDSIEDIYNKHKVIFDILNRLTNVIYVLGNHDPLVMDIHKVLPNIPIVKMYKYKEMKNNKTFLLTHGEEFDRVWMKYFFLAKIFFPFEYVITRIFKISIRDYLKKKLGTLSKYKGEKYYDKFVKDIASYTLQMYSNMADYIIAGHTHYAYIKQGKKSTYLNCGDWLDSFSYIEYNVEEDCFQLCGDF